MELGRSTPQEAKETIRKLFFYRTWLRKFCNGYLSLEEMERAASNLAYLIEERKEREKQDEQSG